MKMQLQSLLLSEASAQRNPEMLKEKCEDLRKELLQWHQSWDADLLSSTSSELYDWEGAVQSLRTWGSLQYNGTILMMSRFSWAQAEDVFDVVREVVSRTSLLFRQHQQMLCGIYDDEIRQQIPVFPTDWTLSHLLFSTGFHLLPSKKLDTGEYNSREQTVRSCLATMALMESDPANLSMGFSKILEELLRS